MRKLFQYIIYMIIFIAGGVTTYLIDRVSLQKDSTALLHHDSSDTEPPVTAKPAILFKYNASIQKDSKDIFNDDSALYSYVKKFGIKQSITHLHELTAIYGDCHHPAHKAGRFAYDLLSNQAFYEAGSECHSGGLHGVIEAYFHENGIKKMTEDLDKICSPNRNNFFSHQCIHGIGHGLMAWSNYALLDVLKYCDRLPKRSDSCWSGAFMENIVGGIAHHNDDGKKNGHVTQYISDDPHYPCTIVDEKYKAGCYFYQTSRMIQIFNGDFAKVAAACSEAKQAYQVHCFESMGRDVGGRFRGDPTGAIKTCGSAPKGASRVHCISGAVQDTFWDYSGQDQAITFCKGLTEDDEKNACYKTIFARAIQILTIKSDLNIFCNKTPDPYRKHCFLSIGI